MKEYLRSIIGVQLFLLCTTFIVLCVMLRKHVQKKIACKKHVEHIYSTYCCPLEVYNWFWDVHVKLQSTKLIII